MENRFFNPSTFQGTVFFLSGCFLREKGIKINGKLAVVSVLIFLVGMFVIGGRCMHSPLQKEDLWKLVMYIVCANAGTLMTAYVSGKIDTIAGKFRSMMIYVGNHTMAILTWHFLCLRGVSLFVIYFYDMPIEKLAMHPVVEDLPLIFWFIYFIVGSSVPLFIDKIEQSLRNGVNNIYQSVKNIKNK